MGLTARSRIYLETSPTRICCVEGCNKPRHCNGVCYLHWNRGYNSHLEAPPTPHDRITVAKWNMGMTGMPPLAALHDTAREGYIADNERDGYLADPEYLAAVAAWKDGTLTDVVTPRHVSYLEAAD